MLCLWLPRSLRLALERKEKEDILNHQRLLDGEKGEGQPSQEASEKGGTSTSVQGLLEEATKVLKRISTATPGLKKGVSSQNPQRDEMMPNLQQQLDQLRESTTSMKVMRLGRLVRNDSGGLLDIVEQLIRFDLVEMMKTNHDLEV